MLRIARIIVVASVATLLLTPVDAEAQEGGGSSPVQLSVFNPVQIVPDTQSVGGLRLSLFHSKNHNVTGFDWVWIGIHQTTGDFVGLAWPGISLHLVEGEMTGLQWTLGNIAGRGMTGGQIGAFNMVGGGRAVGFQAGLVNITEDFTGLQIGLVNYTKRMKGVQIGLVNIITEGPLPFMVIANADF